MADKYLTLNEVAAELRVSRETARRAVQSGTIKGVQVGGPGTTWRVEAKSYRQFKSREINAGGIDTEDDQLEKTG